MFIAFILFQVLACYVGFRCVERAGWLGIKRQRPRLYNYDKIADEQLMRVIGRYRAGELKIRKTVYDENAIAFCKYVEKNGYSIPEATFFVNTRDPKRLDFGWVNSVSVFDSKAMVYHNNDINNPRGTISAKMFAELEQLISEVRVINNIDEVYVL